MCFEITYSIEVYSVVCVSDERGQRVWRYLCAVWAFKCRCSSPIFRCAACNVRVSLAPYQRPPARNQSRPLGQTRCHILPPGTLLSAMDSNRHRARSLRPRYPGYPMEAPFALRLQAQRDQQAVPGKDVSRLGKQGANGATIPAPTACYAFRTRDAELAVA